MECPTRSGEGPELFIAYAAHTLPSATALALERHCKQCAPCREMAWAQQRVWSELDAWQPGKISADFDRDLYARITAEDRRRTRLPLRSVIPVAAACAALLAGYLLRPPSTPRRHTEPAVAIENRIDMEQVERALDDIDMLRQMGVVVPAS